MTALFSRSAPFSAVLFVLLLAGGLLPAGAKAYEGQLSLDAGLGWGLLFADDTVRQGPSAALGTTIGVDDVWAIGVHGGYTLLPFESELGHQVQAGAELLYVVDIGTIVPFFGVGADFFLYADPATTRADLALHVRASADYLLSRELAIGVDIRPYVLLSALSLQPVVVTANLRLSVLFEI